MTSTLTTTNPWTSALDALQCIGCGGGLDGADDESLRCGRCGRVYHIRDGFLLDAIDRLEGNNKVAADFYDSPQWPNFGFWEHFTFFMSSRSRGEN